MKGSVALALKMRISTLVVGMTVVSLATSAPELFVSLEALIEGQVNSDMYKISVFCNSSFNIIILRCVVEGQVNSDM